MAIDDPKTVPLRPGTVRASTLGAVDWIAIALLVIGGLNWALVGLFDFDLVARLFGPMSVLSRAVYILVGLAAVYGIVMATRLSNSTRLST